MLKTKSKLFITVFVSFTRVENQTLNNLFKEQKSLQLIQIFFNIARIGLGKYLKMNNYNEKKKEKHKKLLLLLKNNASSWHLGV